MTYKAVVVDGMQELDFLVIGSRVLLLVCYQEESDGGEEAVTKQNVKGQFPEIHLKYYTHAADNISDSH